MEEGFIGDESALAPASTGNATTEMEQQLDSIMAQPTAETTGEQVYAEGESLLPHQPAVSRPELIFMRII